MDMKLSSYKQHLGSLFLAVLSGIGVILLLLAYHRIFLLEMQGPVTSDFTQYAVVARGILNGLTPYTDLFEARPPGMPLLIALSMKLTNSASLVTVFSLVASVTTVLLFAFFACKSTANESRLRSRLVIIGFALALGISLQLFVQERAGALETESFGAWFGLLYVTTFFYSDKKWITIWRALLLCICIGIKEPFLFSLLGVALLLSNDVRDFIKSFVVPLAIAVVIGSLLLLLLGMFGVYIGDYLPVILNTRMSTELRSPLFLRILDIRKLYGNAVTYTSIPALGVLLTICWVSFLYIKNITLSDRYIWKYVLAAASLTGFIYWSHRLFSYVYPLVFLKHEVIGVPWVKMILLWAIFTSLMIFLIRKLVVSSKESSRILLIATFAILMVSLAVGSGGRYNHYHYVFAAPAYAALLFQLIQSVARREVGQPRLIFVLACATFLLGITYQTPSNHIDELKRLQAYNPRSNKLVIMQFEELMQNCGYSRYVSIGTVDKLAFAKYSPIGPMAEMNRHDYIDPEHEIYQETYRNILSYDWLFCSCMTV